MKPSTERREATAGGRSEEREKGKHKKRVGHGWSRTGEDRAESSTLGLELMELPFLQQYSQKQCMLCFQEHVLPPPLKRHLAFGSSSSLPDPRHWPGLLCCACLPQLSNYTSAIERQQSSVATLSSGGTLCLLPWQPSWMLQGQQHCSASFCSTSCWGKKRWHRLPWEQWGWEGKKEKNWEFLVLLTNFNQWLGSHETGTRSQSLHWSGPCKRFPTMLWNSGP